MSEAPGAASWLEPPVSDTPWSPDFVMQSLEILRELGAEVVTAGRSETFVSIDTENITDEQLDRLEEFAVAAESSGRPLHAIASTDGDSA